MRLGECQFTLILRRIGSYASNFDLIRFTIPATLYSQTSPVIKESTMQTNILWSGREYYSLENCLVKDSEHGSQITSTIVGSYEEKIYNVTYRIETNQNWETTFVKIYCQHNNYTQLIELESEGNGNWLVNNVKSELLKGCLDVDIPLTPFTNTLPIRRLNLSPSRSQEIKVIYCDLLKQEIKPVWQRYTCLSSSEYHYENVPNDFEATILVDESGLVIDYPSLFVRTKALKSNYQ